MADDSTTSPAPSGPPANSHHLKAVRALIELLAQIIKGSPSSFSSTSASASSPSTPDLAAASAELVTTRAHIGLAPQIIMHSPWDDQDPGNGVDFSANPLGNDISHESDLVAGILLTIREIEVLLHKDSGEVTSSSTSSPPIGQSKEPIPLFGLRDLKVLRASASFLAAKGVIPCLPTALSAASASSAATADRNPRLLTNRAGALGWVSIPSGTFPQLSRTIAAAPGVYSALILTDSWLSAPRSNANSVPSTPSQVSQLHLQNNSSSSPSPSNQTDSPFKWEEVADSGYREAFASVVQMISDRVIGTGGLLRTCLALSARRQSPPWLRSHLGNMLTEALLSPGGLVAFLDMVAGASTSVGGEEKDQDKVMEATRSPLLARVVSLVTAVPRRWTTRPGEYYKVLAPPLLEACRLAPGLPGAGSMRSAALAVVRDIALKHPNRARSALFPALWPVLSGKGSDEELTRALEDIHTVVRHASVTGRERAIRRAMQDLIPVLWSVYRALHGGPSHLTRAVGEVLGSLWKHAGKKSALDPRRRAATTAATGKGVPDDDDDDDDGSDDDSSDDQDDEEGLADETPVKLLSMLTGDHGTSLVFGPSEDGGVGFRTESSANQSHSASERAAGADKEARIWVAFAKEHLRRSRLPGAVFAAALDGVLASMKQIQLEDAAGVTAPAMTGSNKLYMEGDEEYDSGDLAARTSHAKYLALLSVLGVLAEGLGADVLGDMPTVVSFLRALLSGGGDVETLDLALGLLGFLTSGAMEIADVDVPLLLSLLPLVEDILRAAVEAADVPEIAELAQSIVLALNSRELTWAAGPQKPEQRSSGNSRHDAPKQSLSSALEDLRDPLLPVRGHGIMALRALFLAQDPDALEAAPRLLPMLTRVLGDPDSYLFLPAIDALSALSEVRPSPTVGTLVDLYRDPDTADDVQMKLGEALVRILERAGPAGAPVAGKVVHSLLYMAVRADTEDTQASALSGLATLAGAGLGYGIQSWVKDMVDVGLTLLRDATHLEHVIHRGSLVLFQALLEHMASGQDSAGLEVMQDDLHRVQMGLRQVRDGFGPAGEDETCRLLAKIALEEVDKMMRSFVNGRT